MTFVETINWDNRNFYNLLYNTKIFTIYIYNNQLTQSLQPNEGHLAKHILNLSHEKQ
jgi:hypothetical protein